MTIHTKTNTLISSSQYKNSIRTYVRFLRHSVRLTEQYIAAQLINNKIITLNNINHAKNIAIFISFDGEIRTDLIIKTLLSMNKRIYLPILPASQSQPLLFAEYNLSTSLIKNRFNIYEPKYNFTTILSIKMLDIIFVPLVAFDEHGNRLGMGKGFYDKTLHFWKSQGKDMCIGLGYEFQKIPNRIFPIEKHDIKLSKVITPHHIY